MIASILKQLNGHGSEVRSLEDALLQLSRDRDEVRSKIDSLQKQRHQMLLADASDADLDKLERQLDRALVRLEKLNLAEPPLLSRLTSARSSARQRRWHQIRDSYLAAAADFLAYARTAADKHAALISLVGEAQSEGFAAEVAATMPLTPNVAGSALLAPDLLDLFERSITPQPPVPAPAPPAAPRTSFTAAEYAQYPGLPGERVDGSMQRATDLRVGAPAGASLTAKRKPDDLTPLEPGQARVMVLSNGWSPRPDLEQCYAGQQLKMPLAAAQLAANRGLVEIMEMATDRTAVVAGDFQIIDPRTPISSLGSGGTELIRLNAGGSDDKGVAKT